jgi:hypothetical protein
MARPDRIDHAGSCTLEDSSEIAGKVGRFVFGPDGRVVPDLSDGPITYYRPHWFTFTWVACQTFASAGCAALDDLRLSLDRPPPPRRDIPPPAPPASPRPPPKKRPTRAEQDRAMAEQLIAVAEGLHRWWTKPPPLSLLPEATTPGKLAERKPPAPRTVPPFDIQQIPDAMDRLRLPVSARMMQHWFAGRANYSRTNDDLIAGIDQDGKPYAPDMIDQRIIDFDWVLQFARARKAHDELVSELIHSPKALSKIADKILAYMACRIRPCSAFNGLSVSNKNVHELHRDFQFQFVGVDSTFVDKALQLVGGKLGLVRSLDDLTGALGSFFIYAALGDVSLDYVTRTACVESIYVYVRDSYSFNDDKEYKSQYLGHWNERSIHLVPTPFVFDSPIARRVGFAAPLVDVDQSIYDKGAVMYPVSNKSFREWRTRHSQGGDFLAYTKPKHVRLAQSLQVKF